MLATLSLPFVVVTTFYGMNFKMPEYEWPWPVAYLWVFGVTAVGTAGVFWFLKRKGWF